MRNVGIDVSKAKLDVHIRPDNNFFTIDNDGKSIKKLITKLKKLQPELILLEPSGGYEQLAYNSLAEAGLKVTLANPKRIRAFAIAINQIAKTDKIDASVIAQFAEVVKPEIRPIPDKKTKALQAILRRRTELVAEKTAETNRLQVAMPEIKEGIKRHINWLTEEIEAIEEILFKAVDENPVFKEKAELLEEVPGVGRILSVTLLLELPELGFLSNKEIAALVGLAPVTRESGTWKGKKSIIGGRKEVRTALFMPTTTAIRHNPVIKEFYNRLTGKGKLYKVSITACMHKLLTILNSIMKSGKTWDPNYFKNKLVTVNN